MIQIVFEAGIKCIKNTSVLGENTKSMKIMEVQELCILDCKNGVRFDPMGLWPGQANYDPSFYYEIISCDESCPTLKSEHNKHNPT